MTSTPEEQGSSISLTLREVEGPEVEIRHMVALGMHPIILIELEQVGESDLAIKIDATGPDDANNLADFLEGVVANLRHFTPTVNVTTGGE